MSLLSTFTTNSINILAGINGSEVGQTLIIALSVILNDLLYLPWPVDFRIPLHLLGNQAEVDIGGVWSAGMAHGSRELVGRHLFSLYFMLPLVGVCIGFMYHNWLVDYTSESWLDGAKGIDNSQVSCSCISWRYILLPRRDGIFCCRDPSPFYEDTSAIFPAANFQLCALLPPVVRPRALS